MNAEVEMRKLVRARKRHEQKIKDLDAKIEHILFRMDEERRCFLRHCPLDEEHDEIP